MAPTPLPSKTTVAFATMVMLVNTLGDDRNDWHHILWLDGSYHNTRVDDHCNAAPAKLGALKIQIQGRGRHNNRLPITHGCA